MSKINNIDFEKDSVILIKFEGTDSLKFEIVPSNVSSIQMLMSAEVMRIQAEHNLSAASLKTIIKQAIAELSQDQDKDISVAKAKVLRV